ncbi:MAG: hypothetical protein KA190_25210 [Kofleriaceae bacterium]|jgi:hypothetical protein|nr:hypothetical protein [Kofleriaceae bacterium]
MLVSSIRWGRAVLGAVVAEATQIALAVAWVAVYSLVLAPGQPEAAYQAHAQASGPWVSILLGAPVFYAASRWIARDLRTALVLFVVFLGLDLALLVVVPGSSLDPVLLLLMTTSYATKLVACGLGGRHAARRRAVASATAGTEAAPS